MTRTIQPLPFLTGGLSTLYHVVSVEVQDTSSEEVVGSTPQPV